MNEEEKKSIEILKERKKYLLGLSKSSFYSCDRKLYKEHVEAIETILNLIDKQQKEIERKDKVFDDCKYTIIEYVKTAKDTMQKMEAMIEIEKDVINEFDKLLKGE